MVYFSSFFFVHQEFSFYFEYLCYICVYMLICRCLYMYDIFPRTQGFVWHIKVFLLSHLTVEQIVWFHLFAYIKVICQILFLFWVFCRFWFGWLYFFICTFYFYFWWVLFISYFLHLLFVSEYFQLHKLTHYSLRPHYTSKKEEFWLFVKLKA